MIHDLRDAQIGLGRAGYTDQDGLPIGRENWSIDDLLSPGAGESDLPGITSIGICQEQVIPSSIRINGDVDEPGGVRGYAGPERVGSNFFRLTIRISHTEEIVNRVELTWK
jgi:hypothetical protein